MLTAKLTTCHTCTYKVAYNDNNGRIAKNVWSKRSGACVCLFACDRLEKHDNDVYRIRISTYFNSNAISFHFISNSTEIKTNQSTLSMSTPPENALSLPKKFKSQAQLEKFERQKNSSRVIFWQNYLCLLPVVDLFSLLLSFFLSFVHPFLSIEDKQNKAKAFASLRTRES